MRLRTYNLRLCYDAINRDTGQWYSTTNGFQAATEKVYADLIQQRDLMAARKDRRNIRIELSAQGELLKDVLTWSAASELMHDGEWQHRPPIERGQSIVASSFNDTGSIELYGPFVNSDAAEAWRTANFLGTAYDRSFVLEVVKP